MSVWARLSIQAGAGRMPHYVAGVHTAWRVEGAFGTLRSVDEIRVESAGDGAVVTYDARLGMRGVLRVADPLLALAFGRIGDRAAAGLRRALGGEHAGPS